MVREWKLADGRIYQGHHLSLDKYKLANGVVTQRQCKDCGEFRPISEFTLIKRGEAHYFNSYCRNCYLYKDAVYHEGYRRVRGISRRELTEFSITRKDEVQGIVCITCNEWHPLDYYPKGRGRICRQCRWQKVHGHWLVRRIRAIYGEDSPEYRLVKDETRYHYIKAVCKMLGMVLHRRILSPEVQWPVCRILPRLSGRDIPSETREFLEKACRLEVSKNYKRLTGATYVSLLGLPSVQVSH